MSQEIKKPKVKVLYQRLGATWYAFATVGEEIFIGKVPIHATASETEAAEKFQETMKARKAKRTPAAA